jgi:ectoine hydroxylase-related dioxygenase (phytanoyl-CoA dioxygenase family)
VAHAAEPEDARNLPVADARGAAALSDAEAAAFRGAGALVVRGLLAPGELAALRAQTLPLVERAAAERVRDIDTQYKRHAASGREVPFRIEYVVDKLPACRALLGHPFVLRSVERLQGRDFVPTWDSMVFKLAGAGAAIDWHRDAGTDQCDPGVPIFNVDVYLDGSDASNCLWALPGSNRWSDAEAERECARRNAGGFATDGALRLPLEPGDALLHDILLVHGSPPAASGLRRVLYYEFRPADVERRRGPHTPDYLPLKQRVLLACLRDRAATPWARGEEPFDYRPTGAFPAPSLARGEVLPTYRYPHHEHWRWDLEKARAEARAGAESGASHDPA